MPPRRAFLNPRAALVAGWAALALPITVPPAVAEEIRFEGTAFEAPEGWAVNPNTRPGIWQVQRRFDEGRGRPSRAAQADWSG